MDLVKLLRNASHHAGTLRDASRSGNLSVLRSLLGPAVRGFVLQRGKQGSSAELEARHRAFFSWDYTRDHPQLGKLYTAAKREQWDSDTALDWSIDVDPYSTERELVDDTALPLQAIPSYRSLPLRKQQEQRHALLAWMLSQSLHGEQGALFAACQVTEAVEWIDGKFYGATQVMDEGRHVEVFHRYLTQKLGRMWQVNDNLYVIVDALMTDSRWDIKFLGMQIMIEGLALGAFGTFRTATQEPLLKELLKRVITDEARHVHYGVVALEEFYRHGLSAPELREREDWAFEMALLLRNRFLAHEFYEEFYGQAMRRSAWDALILRSEYLQRFRTTMFRRIIPNLKRIGLLSPRIRPHYQALGLLEFEHGKAAPELGADDLLLG